MADGSGSNLERCRRNVVWIFPLQFWGQPTLRAIVRRKGAKGDPDLFYEMPENA
jgi:hypothetical protein